MTPFKKSFPTVEYQASARETLKSILAAVEDPDTILASFGGETRWAIALASLDAMDQQAGPARPYLFRRQSDENGLVATRRLNALMRRAGKGDRPSLPALAAAWLDELGIDREKQETKVLLLTAARAELVHRLPPADARTDCQEPAYHNRLHFLQVFQSVCYQIQAQRELQARYPALPDLLLQAHLDDDAVCTVMIAAMAHDIDHPGRGNPKDPAKQIPVRFFNEDASAAVTYPFIETLCGRQTGKRLYETIKTHIRFTDPGAPRCVDLYGALDTVRGGHNPPSDPLYNNPGTLAFWACTAMLSDADVLLSTAAGLKSNQSCSLKLNKEAQASSLSLDFTTLAARKFFFDVIVGGKGLQSGPSRILFNPSFEKFRQKTEKQMLAI